MFNVTTDSCVVKKEKDPSSCVFIFGRKYTLKHPVDSKNYSFKPVVNYAVSIGSVSINNFQSRKFLLVQRAHMQSVRAHCSFIKIVYVFWCIFLRTKPPL